MKVILFQPDIPQNTGNILRTCYATNTELIIVEPASFSLSDRHLKRAGLDYFHDMPITKIDNLEEYLHQTHHPFYFFSSKAKKSYFSISYPKNSVFIFGSETAGLPNHFFTHWKEKFVTIPMVTKARCLNLSNCVAIALYEAIRQHEQEKKLTFKKRKDQC